MAQKCRFLVRVEQEATRAGDIDLNPFCCSSEPDERQLMPAAVWSATGMADTTFSAGSPEAACILKIQRMIMIRGGQRAPADLAFGQIREIKAIVDRHALQVRYVAAIGALIGLLDHKRAVPTRANVCSVCKHFFRNLDCCE